MAFRFVRGAGDVDEPATILLPASGIVRVGGVVEYDTVAGLVSAASSSSRSTNIIGVSLDYVQGASDTFVRVLPFIPGQIWEADVVNAVATTNVLLRHQLSTDLLLANVTKLSETASAGVFLALAITGATTGSGKLLGTFLQQTPFRSGNYAISG